MNLLPFLPLGLNTKRLLNETIFMENVTFVSVWLYSAVEVCYDA